MNNRLQNEFGMTLLELLGTIVILGIISSLTFPIILNGLKTATSVQKEVMLRDEADYLMAALVKELYTTKESEIEVIYKSKSKTEIDCIIKLNGNRDWDCNNNDKTVLKTGFIDNQFIVANQTINTKNKIISLSPNSSIHKLDDGQYEVNFILVLHGKIEKTMEFQNLITTIQDKEEET